jgi:hypothetical protein
MAKSSSTFSGTANEGQRAVAVMPNGKSVPQYLVEAVYLAVTESLPGLLRDVSYTTEMLCGPDLWSEWTDGEKRSAGKCLSGLVEAGRLPLVPVIWLHEYPLRFRLK